MKPHNRSNLPPRGFTLIEALIVMAIAAVLLAGVIPFARGAIARAALSTAVQDFVSAAHLARTDAIRRNGRVVLCKSADGMACATSGGWEQGWIVFHDANNNAQHDPGEEQVATVGRLGQGLVLRGNASVDDYVSYGADGTARKVNGAFQAGTLTLCFAGSAVTEGRSIVINATGRLRSQAVSVAACPA